MIHIELSWNRLNEVSAAHGDDAKASAQRFQLLDGPDQVVSGVRKSNFKTLGRSGLTLRCVRETDRRANRLYCELQQRRMLVHFKGQQLITATFSDCSWKLMKRKRKRPEHVQIIHRTQRGSRPLPEKGHQWFECLSEPRGTDSNLFEYTSSPSSEKTDVQRAWLIASCLCYFFNIPGLHCSLRQVSWELHRKQPLIYIFLVGFTQLDYLGQFMPHHLTLNLVPSLFRFLY